MLPRGRCTVRAHPTRAGHHTQSPPPPKPPKWPERVQTKQWPNAVAACLKGRGRAPPRGHEALLRVGGPDGRVALPSGRIPSGQRHGPDQRSRHTTTSAQRNRREIRNGTSRTAVATACTTKTVGRKSAPDGVSVSGLPSARRGLGGGEAQGVGHLGTTLCLGVLGSQSPLPVPAPGNRWEGGGGSPLPPKHSGLDSTPKAFPYPNHRPNRCHIPCDRSATALELPPSPQSPSSKALACPLGWDPFLPLLYAIAVE